MINWDNNFLSICSDNSVKNSQFPKAEFPWLNFPCLSWTHLGGTSKCLSYSQQACLWQGRIPLDTLGGWQIFEP
jgi:hypothetical protein